MARINKIFDILATMEDPEKIKRLRRNALDQDAPELAEAAFRRLVAIAPQQGDEPAERDFWTAIHALELALSEERGRATRLTRTRQKIARSGALETMADLTLNPREGEGFRMLVDRGMADLTAEATVLRHPDAFASNVLEAARARLEGASASAEAEAEPGPAQGG